MNEHGNHKDRDMEHDHDKPAEDNEIASWKRKLFWSWLLTIPIAVLMLSERLFGFAIVEMPYSIALILALGFPVIFIFGFDTIRSGTRGLFTFYFNMDSLIALGTIVAYVTGIFAFWEYVADYFMLLEYLHFGNMLQIIRVLLR
ncbi:cation-translocating P-type ATPase [Candidatus Pacearchaeota archaeon]|nr:cation-translocating P-type ATPase [Candidatus Pacearchaeota archaeon]